MIFAPATSHEVIPHSALEAAAVPLQYNLYMSELCNRIWAWTTPPEICQTIFKNVFHSPECSATYSLAEAALNEGFPLRETLIPWHEAWSPISLFPDKAIYGVYGHTANAIHYVCGAFLGCLEGVARESLDLACRAFHAEQGLLASHPNTTLALLPPLQQVIQPILDVAGPACTALCDTTTRVCEYISTNSDNTVVQAFFHKGTCLISDHPFQPSLHAQNVQNLFIPPSVPSPPSFFTDFTVPWTPQQFWSMMGLVMFAANMWDTISKSSPKSPPEQTPPLPPEEKNKKEVETKTVKTPPPKPSPKLPEDPLNKPPREPFDPKENWVERVVIEYDFPMQYAATRRLKKGGFVNSMTAAGLFVGGVFYSTWRACTHVLNPRKAAPHFGAALLSLPPFCLFPHLSTAFFVRYLGLLTDHSKIEVWNNIN